MRTVFFFPTRFHIFDQISADCFDGMDFEIYSIYPRFFFRRSKNFSHLGSKNKTLWIGAALRVLLIFATRMGAGPTTLRKLRDIYVSGCGLEFAIRMQRRDKTLIVASAGYLGGLSERLRLKGHLLAINHGSLYERREREIMLTHFGAKSEGENVNWSNPHLINRMDIEFVTADRIIVCSDAARESFPDELVSRVAIVPLGTKRNAEATQEKKPKEGQGVVFLHYSGLSLRKNLPGVVAAFAQMRSPEDRLVIGGPTPQHHTLQRLLANLGPGAEWIGRLDRSRVADALGKADVFVHPSFADGWAMAVTEALAAGLPVVASPLTGAASYYAGELGADQQALLLADPTSISEIATAMATMRDRVKKGGFSVASPLSWNESASKLKACLHGMLEGTE